MYLRHDISCESFTVASAERVNINQYQQADVWMKEKSRRGGEIGEGGAGDLRLVAVKQDFPSAISFDRNRCTPQEKCQEMVSD